MFDEFNRRIGSENSALCIFKLRSDRSLHFVEAAQTLETTKVEEA